MELSDYLRDPMSAALIAAAITAGYIHVKAQLNNEGKLELNKYAKPAERIDPFKGIQDL